MSVTPYQDDWVKAALTNDALVAELLLRIANNSYKGKKRGLPLEWTVQKPRSNKSGSVKPPAFHRASPTTPLSLSCGATSFSGGFEESATLTRSKINDASEKTAGKKPRKKKTLAQLKEEESSLVKERRELKREITAMRMNLEKQRAANESLKRRKLELLPHSSVSASVHEGSVSGHPAEGNATTQPSNPRFVLPDLNMPFEDSSIHRDS